MATLVMKFGGASVATPEHFAQIAEIISERSTKYQHIAVVVSAMGKMTDELITLAHQVHTQPPDRELDMLVSVGERVSIALLAMALARKGKEAVSFTGSQSGIITSNEHVQAKILTVRPYRLMEKLNEGKIVIIAGFQGVSRRGEITTLGRGGSDTSAVAIATALAAELGEVKVEFFKDVLGIYSNDPKVDPEARLLPLLTYEEAIAIARGGAKVVHLRALLLAEKNEIPLNVLSFENPNYVGTRIGLNEGCRIGQPIYEEVEYADCHSL